MRDEKNILSKELFEKVQKSYKSVLIKSPSDNEFLNKFYEKASTIDENDAELHKHTRQLFHTSYQQIEKMHVSLAIKW